MLVLIIILSVFVLLALLRAGVILQYNEAGLALWLKIGFIKKRLKHDAIGMEHIHKLNLGDIKPGGPGEFMHMLGCMKNALGRLRRRLLVKKLAVYYAPAGDDPAKTAMAFGAASAVFGAIVPVLERSFRIKRRDLRAAADFTSSKPKIYVMLSISIAVWEAFYVISALFPIFGKSSAKTKAGASIADRAAGKAKRPATMRKDVKRDGERTDKQPA